MLQHTIEILIHKGRDVEGNYIYVGTQSVLVMSQVVNTLRQAVFCGLCLHGFLGFPSPFLYLKSLRITKSCFGIEVLTFRACQGNLSHFSNKIKFSHFCLSLVGQNVCSLPTCELSLPLKVLLQSSFTFVETILFLSAVLAVDGLLFVSEQLAVKQVNSMARPAMVVYI